MSEETTASLARLADQINSALGPGTIRLGSDPSLEVKYWPTGVLPIDYLLNGGMPAGRFIEIFGDYSTLKSFIALKALGSVQALGGRSALVDTEHAYDPEWAALLGVDPDQLLVQQPDTAEDGVAIMEILVRDGYDLIVWDSVATSQPKQYREARPGESADVAPAGLARVMSAGLRRLNSANKKTSIVALNQTRVNVGMTYGGVRDTTPGGKALPFYASYRLKLTKAGKITEDTKVHDGEKMVPGKRVLAQKIKASLEKSKLSAPFQETWFLYDLRTGQVDETMFLMSQGLERGLIKEGAGGRFTIPGKLDTSVHGKPKFKQWLLDNPEALVWLKSTIIPPGASPTTTPKPTATVQGGTPPGSPRPAKNKGGRPKKKS